MTSEERREARYQRRRARREARKRERMRSCDSFEEVFSYEHLYHSYRRCRRNVAWKASVQRYVCQAPLNVHLTRKALMDGSYRPRTLNEFDIVDRGKERHIKSVSMPDRVVQRCLCDHCLVPAVSRTLVYDNGASLDGKGYQFAHERLKKHLRDHHRRHGSEGYVLLFDFHGYFDSIPHRLVRSIVEREVSDARLRELCMEIVALSGEGRGLGLGSQISQILALAAAGRVDHHVKDVLGVHGYGRYMDDGYVIHGSKEFLRRCLSDIRAIVSGLGLELNERKTQIVKITHGFTFCKARYDLLPSGKVLRRLSPRTVTRMRRRLKAFRRKADAGRMTGEDAWLSYQSWRAYASWFDSHRSVASTDEVFARLFPDEAWRLRRRGNRKSNSLPNK